jgi:hypothetical protein
MDEQERADYQHLLEVIADRARWRHHAEVLYEALDELMHLEREGVRDADWHDRFDRAWRNARAAITATPIDMVSMKEER